jgi:hypothetical protein
VACTRGLAAPCPYRQTPRGHASKSSSRSLPEPTMDRAFVPCWAPRGTCAAGELPACAGAGHPSPRRLFGVPGAPRPGIINKRRAAPRARREPSETREQRRPTSTCVVPLDRGGEILRVEEVWRADDSCSRSTSCSLRVPQCSDLILLYTVAVESVKTYLTLPLYIWLKEVRIATLTTLPTSLKHHSILCYYPHGGFQRPWQVLDDGKSG